MFDASPFVNPTPLAHADASRDVLPRGEYSGFRRSEDKSAYGKSVKWKAVKIEKFVVSPVGSCLSPTQKFECVGGNSNCLLLCHAFLTDPLSTPRFRTSCFADVRITGRRQLVEFAD
ncbi:hypothetical protein TNCV_1993781 [Trichonephila clavipes]|nr:hypothetical protein TNCV_1993781 [Trichonephila clavipes]